MNALDSAMLQLSKDKPVAYGIETGFKDLVNIHNEWIRQFIISSDDLTLLAHRGSYKTTCLSIAMALIIILYPGKTMLFMRKADNDVKEIISQVGKLLEQAMFQSLAIELYGRPIKFNTYSTFEIDTNLHIGAKGTPQLIGIGTGGSLTGKHVDIVITDDIVTAKDRVSKAERERIKLIYQELENIKNPGGRFINTGTPWHKEDAIGKMPNTTSYDVYSTGLLDKEEIQKLRGKMTSSLFAANYELKHIADEDAIFKNPNFATKEESQLVMNGISQVDAAYGGADSTAFTIAKKVGDRYYVLGKSRKKHIDDCMYEIKHLQEQYKAGSIYNELNADKGYSAKELGKLGMSVKTYHEKMNKYLKIVTFLRREWNNIYFLEETDADYLNTILDYTENAEHDDAPDSLASLIRIYDSIENNKSENLVSKLRTRGL